MKKKLIDIYPPNSREHDVWEEKSGGESARSARGRSGWFSKKIVVASIVFVVVFPLAFTHFFLARATVQVWPHITRLEIEEAITVQAGVETVGLAKQIVRGQAFKQEKVVSDVFAATGQKQKEERAHGTIRVHNTQPASSQTLVANTRFIAENGELFRSQERIVIPANSSVEVAVVAAEPGEEYNIGPSNFSLPGLVGSPLYTAIYGESSAAMAGGTARQVAVVTASDIAQAKEQLVQRGIQEATDALRVQVPGEFQVVENSISSEVLQDDSLVKEGAELDQFNYRVSVRVSAFGFHAGDVTQLAQHIVLGYLRDGQAINETTLSIVPRAQETSANTGTMPMVLEISVDRYEQLDNREFTQELMGVPEHGFEQVMARRPHLAKAKFSLWPFWLRGVPNNDSKISLELRLDEGP